MDGGRRREGLRSGAIVAGSVWESRMKVDEVKGGIKVFNGDQEISEETTTNTSSNAGAGTRTRLKKGGGTGGGGGAVTAAGKRKTWKSESSEGLEKNPVSPIQISKGKTESLKNCDEQCKELSVSVDGVKKSPTQVMRRLRSEGSPTGSRKPRSELLKSASDLGKNCGEASDLGIERDSKSIQLRKVKSESNKGLDNEDQLRKTKSESITETVDESDKEIEKTPVEIENSGSDENCKEFGVCQEMVISSNVDDVALESAPKPLVPEEEDDGDQLEEEEEEEEEEVVDEEIEAEIEQKSVDIKEINVNPPEEKSSSKVNVDEEKKVMEVHEEKKVMKVDEEKKVMKVNEEKKVMKVKEEKKVMKVNEVKKVLELERREVKKLHQFNQKPEPISLNLKKPAPVIKRASVHSNISKYPNSSSNVYQSSSFPETHTRLQSLVDLIMWKDISRSVFVFGIGTFVILSSSYTKDLNISFISVISYMGLLYLAAIFLFKSIICRGALETDNANYVVGEQEAIWLLKLVLPYLNELLLKIRALFSGDPPTTIKLAVLLFVLARCGSSITIWTMSKVGFFGVFTVPKVCSLYSAQMTVYANFWVRRFRDAWDSCTHKKALSIGIFLVVWNLSSVVARIWAAFILVVAFRYYQQKLVIEEEWAEEVEDEAGGEEETWQGGLGRTTQGQAEVDITKPKKGF